MPLYIQELTIDNISWTSYAPPDDVNVIGVYNKDTANDLKFRANSGDPTTEVIITAGQEKKWGDYNQTAQTMARYPNGKTFGYFQSVVGTGPVKIEAGR